MEKLTDVQVRMKINAKLTTFNVSGHPCHRRANAVFATYQMIKAYGYEQLANQRSTAFFANVNGLILAGISREFLKSITITKKLPRG
jgi:hypothetical protein